MAVDRSIDPPLMNTALEDVLAYATSEHERESLLRAWIMLGFENLARQAGRTVAVEHSLNMTTFLRQATPTKPWRD